MFSKYSLSLIVAGLFVFSFIAFSSPEKAFAGNALGPGCCINNSGNCAGGCGSEASNCQTEQLGSCPDISDAADCNGNLGGPGSGFTKCFVPGGVCNQTTNTKGICSEGPPTPTGCEVADDCPDPDPECVEPVCTDRTCTTTPLEGSDKNPNCNPPEPPVATTIIPTMGQWGMMLAAMVLGIFAIIRIRSLKDSELS